MADEQGNDQRRRIIDAALKVFSEKGYARSTVRAIAAEANMTTGAIYYYFKDKDDLLAAAMEYAVHYVRRLSPVGADGTTRLEDDFLQDVEKATVERLKDRDLQKMQLMLASELATHEGATLERHRENYDGIIRTTAEYFEPALGTQSDDAYYLASILVAALDGMAFQSVLGVHDDDMDKMAEVFNKFFVEGIQNYR